MYNDREMTAPGLYGQRPSKCADGARRAQFARIQAMTARERVLAALALGRWGDVLRSGGTRPSR